MSQQKLMWKLQKALKQKGVIVNINLVQFYSTQYGRHITIYKVIEQKNELSSSASLIKTIKILAQRLEQERNINIHEE